MKITIQIVGQVAKIVIDNGSTVPDMLVEEIHHMAQDLDDLKTEVANTATVEQSAIAMIQGLEDRLSAIIPPTGESVDPADLIALRDQLASSRTALAAAITSGTSADTSGAGTGTTDTTGTGDAGAPTGTATGTATDTGGDAGAPASTATDTGSGDSGNAAGGDGSSAGTGDGSDAGGDVQPQAGIDTTVDESANDQVVDDQSGGGGE